MYTTPLTDAELRQADTHTRARYLRIVMLMNDTGCSFAMAVQAVDAAERQERDQ